MGKITLEKPFFEGHSESIFFPFKKCIFLILDNTIYDMFSNEWKIEFRTSEKFASSIIGIMNFPMISKFIFEPIIHEFIFDDFMRLIFVFFIGRKNGFSRTFFM